MNNMTKEELLNRVNKLQKFKDYVHRRLDVMGVPTDPEPESNKKHGCRIEGRLNYIGTQLTILRKKWARPTRMDMDGDL